MTVTWTTHKCMINLSPALYGSPQRANCQRAANHHFAGIFVCHEHLAKLRDAAAELVAHDVATARADVLVARVELNRVEDEIRALREPLWRARAVGNRRYARERHEGFVYYAERQGYIKIGFSLRVEERIAQLAAGGTLAPPDMTQGPLRLLVKHGGGLPVEQAMHRRFASARVVGEWFWPTADLCGHIGALARRQSRSGEARGVITYTRRLAAMSPAS